MYVHLQEQAAISPKRKLTRRFSSYSLTGNFPSLSFVAYAVELEAACRLSLPVCLFKIVLWVYFNSFCSGNMCQRLNVLVVVHLSPKDVDLRIVRASYLCRFLPKNIHVIGYARTGLTAEGFHSRLRPYLEGDQLQIDKFLERCSYVSGTYDSPTGFVKLNQALQEREQEFACCPAGRLYYLALPPDVYPQVCLGLKVGCEQSFVRVLTCSRCKVLLWRISKWCQDALLFASSRNIVTILCLQLRAHGFAWLWRSLLEKT